MARIAHLPRRSLLAALSIALACSPATPGASVAGPYALSCTDVKRTGSTLTASCTDFFGERVTSSLPDAPSCANVENVNGALRCVRSQTAATGHGGATLVDIVSLVSDVTSGTTETRTWRIDQPDVTKADDAFPQITFREGDVVAFQAGGCVQTGGLGATWKSYVTPLGASATNLYHGTGWVPGSAAGGFERLESLAKAPSRVGTNLDPATQRKLYLHLGYEDDALSDNGYWSHDDGDGGQCRGVGPAWVTVTVQSSGVSGWTPHTMPFDLVWDLGKEDWNGLPSNPRWGYEIDHPGSSPDFVALCGSAVVNGGVGSTGSVDSAKLASVCSSQAPTTDLYTDEFLRTFGLCPADPLNGHLNWALATYTGQVNWADYSGGWPQDGDYNMSLLPPGGAGLTTASPTLGLEFRDTETLDRCGTAWWQNLRSVAASDAAKKTLGGNGGLLGVVTGLVGLDAVHGAYTELHPVLALALRTAEKETDGAVDETWTFFLRTSGNEGECSQETHSWDSPTNEYFIELPWPAAALDMTPGATELWSWEDEAPTAEVLAGGARSTVLKIAFPGTGGQHGADGQVVLHYTRPPGTTPTALAAQPPTAPRFHAPEPELDLGRITDPVLRQKLETELRDAAPSPAPTTPRTKRTFDTSHFRSPAARPLPRSKLVHPRHQPPAGGHPQREKRDAIFKKYRPFLQLVPASSPRTPR